MPQNKANLPSQAILKGLAKLKHSGLLYRAESGFSLLTVDCLTFPDTLPLGRCQFYNSLTLRPSKKNKSADLHSRYLQGFPLSDLSAAAPPDSLRSPRKIGIIQAIQEKSVPLHKTKDKSSIFTMDSLTFKPIPSAPYNVSSLAFADILSASLSVYFTSIGRYFFSSFTFPEDLAINTRFFIAVRSSCLIFNTLL